MLYIGQEEIDAVAAVVTSGRMFRYDKDGQCGRFERRYGEFLGVRHVCMTASGSSAIAAALSALGIGPGCEVIVPSHTYMASATAVLAAGAIPVIVDVDESITLDPQAFADAIGPRTKAVIPVHMWGTVCDMEPILRVARRRRIKVVEDACQCVGGAYHGRPVGSLGHAGAFSFNYFKNMTCGEGGAVASDDDKVMARVRCIIDCCGYFWSGRREDFKPFASNGARASEFEGAILNAQLDRLPGLIANLRAMKKKILAATVAGPLGAAPARALEGECATSLVYQLPTAAQALRFAELAGGTVTSRTGRHTFTEWDPILARRGAPHPALDPFRLPQNRGCRMTYSKKMCPRSLAILDRTVLVGLSPRWTPADVKALVAKVKGATAAVAAM
ncbi:MAG: UDP-4-amino-4-deoxy-L-arabinose--oxoglutarate aminotransferase [Lentisphaerae bacterium ADurb.BinA184]|nr:MAG: UDP-4-amino-4-deoxy-L-arabinose--oxoglutarate aminotransferase [Lentisphaerae bacterium ADurb.BinA184]